MELKEFMDISKLQKIQDNFLIVYYNLFVKLWKNWGEYQGEIEEIDRRTVT